MSLEFQAAAARRMRRLIVALVVLVVVLAGTVLLLAVRSGDPAPAAGGSPPATGDTGAARTPSAGLVEPTTTFTPDPNFVAPTQWVRLPKATSTRLGLPTGYEHTPQGAAATAVTATQLGGTWDVEAADRVVQVYAAPADRERMRTVTRQLITQARANLGLPSSGPLPAAARLTVTPIGVQWTVTDADAVQVSVLVRTSYTTPGNAEKTELASSPLQMVWTEEDWHNAAFSSKPDTPKPADLGSTAFNMAGWKAIQQGSGG